ncbi:MAG: ABC transporter permease [Coriobacteriia bacterium]|nr:ABC transporter permease [Coriobacteriia bacterium]
MSLARIWRVLRKDLALGPRSPFFLWALVLPVGMTLLVQVAFGSLFEPVPRIGILDEGSSAITASVAEMEGIVLERFDDAGELRAAVEANDLDAGLILPAGFDDSVRAGEQPPLEFFIGGESYAANRIILSVTTIDLIREVEGSAAPVEVEVVSFGDEGLPISARLVPVVVFYALVMAGVFVPGSSLVEEKEHGTLMAMLVTPVRSREVMVAKWALGLLLATVMSVVTLMLNRAMGARPVEVVLVVVVAGALTSMLGILAGVVAKDSTMFFGLVKGTGVLLFAPVIFYVFPDWPQWIAKLFPLYWVIEPIWQVSVMGASITTVWQELAIALGITVALIPVTAFLARRMQAQMAGQ